MEINNLLGKLGPYDQSKVEKANEDAAKARKDKAAESGSAGDRVSLSDEAKLRTEALGAAASASEVRREKVAAIKAQIESGEYQIDTRKIAENMVKEDLELII
ncbi:MAG: flagellar biosynthesis anti-sigma factor FlgM [Desulfovibrio sp.]|nr:MAG: flagellar biosynthesis anti-sigma factor FlgM [Desulfovibrio sp.]